MSVSANGTERRWAWAAAGAAVIVLGVLWLFSLALPPAPVNTVRPGPQIGLQKLAPGSALTDEATLLDPRPLFLPTEWNATQMDVAPPDPGGSFQSSPFPAKLSFVELDLRLGRLPANAAGKPADAAKLQNSVDLPDPVTVPASPAEALSSGGLGTLLIGFGRSDSSVVALPPRGAVVEIVRGDTGGPALHTAEMAQVEALAAVAHPPGNRAWGPMEFAAEINAAGLAAPLMMTTRSGAEDVDVYFKNFLVRTLRIGERLRPGFYRISVGP